MPAAMRPYSMAVAPDSSERNFAKSCFKLTSSVLFGARLQVPQGEHGFQR
jgi:hypothetical protein